MIFSRFVIITTPGAIPDGTRDKLEFGTHGVSGVLPGAHIKVGGIFEKQSPTSGHLLFAAAQVPLRHLPKVTATGHVVVDPKVRVATEEALEHYANLLSVAHCMSRSISSPEPPVAFGAQNDEERAFLAKAMGIYCETDDRSVPGAVYGFDPKVHLEHLSDRHDGLAILAEALGHTRASGRFRENIRLFERAFAIGGHKLIAPLTEFLSSAPQRGYTDTEVGRWLAIRDGVTHADKRNHILFEADVAWVDQRVLQAAYDVLLNKKSWRTSEAQRRDEWKPACGTVSADGGLFGYAGEAWNITFKVLDQFRRYPQHLEGNLTTLFPGWWAGPKWGPLGVLAAATGTGESGAAERTDASRDDGQQP